MPCWYEGPLAAFDVETNGPDVESDRIVAAAVVTQATADEPVEVVRWLVDPGVPVPEAARAVHGLSDDFLRVHGRRPEPVMEELGRELAARCAAGIPLVVMNAPFDLTLLDRELRRHRGTPLSAYFTGPAWSVLDPRVLDRHFDRCREDSRTLTDLCAHYEVAPDGTHDAAGDATAALDLVRAIGRRYALRLDACGPAELHARQAVWHAAQAHGRQLWFAGQGSTGEVRDPAWPLRPRPRPPARAVA